MNATVERIVELLFEDLEMSDEVAAIKDEVMNNCQERYDDMMAAGMSEDDAIGAVIESLKGMEDMLAEYPKKTAEAMDTQSGSEDGVCRLVFPASDFRQIDIHMTYQDVKIERSSDALVHVEFSEDSPFMVENSGRVLKINYVERLRKTGAKVKFVHNKRTFAFQGDANINSIGDLFDALKNFKFSIGTDFDNELRISIPDQCIEELHVYTASGEVEAEDIAVGKLFVSTASGEIKVDLCDDVMAKQVELKTASGDVEAVLMAQQASIQSISGDVSLEGRIKEAGMSSVSGDLTVRADLQQLNFKTVSGDADILLDSDEINAVQGKTTSGDVRMRMPHNVRAEIQAYSRSGDVRCSRNDDGEKTARVEIHTVSGDVNIR